MATQADAGGASRSASSRVVAPSGGVEDADASERSLQEVPSSESAGAYALVDNIPSSLRSRDLRRYRPRTPHRAGELARPNIEITNSTTIIQITWVNECGCV